MRCALQANAKRSCRPPRSCSRAGGFTRVTVGKTAALQVAQAQRDLVASQVSEVEASIGYLKALTNLYYLEGSLLDRRGIGLTGVP